MAGGGKVSCLGIAEGPKNKAPFSLPQTAFPKLVPSRCFEEQLPSAPASMAVLTGVVTVAAIVMGLSHPPVTSVTVAHMGGAGHWQG